MMSILITISIDRKTQLMIQALEDHLDDGFNRSSFFRKMIKQKYHKELENGDQINETRGEQVPN